MVRKFIAAAALSAMLVAAPTFAAPCKDAKGKFVKCPAAAPAAKPAPAAKATAAAAPAAKKAAPAAAAGGVNKDKNGRCHVASGPKKGQFTKCM